MSDRLDDVLASVGRHLVIDATADDVGPPVTDATGVWTRTRRRLLVAAIVVAIVAGSIASIPPARRAVGGWLRAGRIDVHLDPDMTIDPGLPSFVDSVTPIDPADATAMLGNAVPDLTSTTLGAPSGWWTVPEGGVVVTWNEGETSLWVVPSGPNGAGNIDKFTTGDGADTATWLPDLGNGGIAIAGEHLVQTLHRTVAADAVVVWDEGGNTLRLESTLPIDALVVLARSISERG